MSDRLDLPEDTLAQVDEYLGHVEDGRWVCVWRDAYGIEYDASEDMRALHARVRELGADNERLQTLCGNLAKTGGKHAHEEARLRGRVAELEAQAAREAETATLSEPLMEYGEVHVQGMWELNGLASEGWRVVAATYIPPQVGTGRQGWNCLLGKPRN